MSAFLSRLSEMRYFPGFAFLGSSVTVKLAVYNLTNAGAAVGGSTADLKMTDVKLPPDIWILSPLESCAQATLVPLPKVAASFRVTL